MATAATVEISESNGAGEVVTNGIANTNWGGADVPNLVPATHPIVNAGTIPTYSFFKAQRFHVTSMGDSATLQAWRVWKSAGAYKAFEGMLFVSVNANVYHQPSQLGVNTVIGSGGSMPTADPVVANVYGGAIIAAPAYTYYFYTQEFINDGGLTPTGALNTKTIVFEWDES